jgi:hypothetical protein
MMTCFVLRYETELQSVQWSCVRKGAILGLLIGWLYFMIYIIYFVAFLVGSRLMIDAGWNVVKISNIPIVNYLIIMNYARSNNYIFEQVAILFASSITFLGSVSPCFQSLIEACCAAAQIFALIDEVRYLFF